ncbi:MAG: hypothetical protein JXB34_04890 [Bacteroidales bacterium]|nr:hypothetical protein [Bacteroidales bacterium]
MKKFILSIFSVCLFTLAHSQENEYQTIGDFTNIKISGFGGPVMSFTQIGGDFVHMMGGGGGVIINNLFLGAYGMGKTNEIAFKNNPDNVMVFGHGGFWAGYTFTGHKAIHPVIHAQIGWGSIMEYQSGWQSHSITPEPLSTDNVLVFNPTAEIELNFSRFFRLGGGVTYNLVYNTDNVYTSRDFAKPGFFLSFKFGYFR